MHRFKILRQIAGVIFTLVLACSGSAPWLIGCAEDEADDQKRDLSLNGYWNLYVKPHEGAEEYQDIYYLNQKGKKVTGLWISGTNTGNTVIITWKGHSGQEEYVLKGKAVSEIGATLTAGLVSGTYVKYEEEETLEGGTFNFLRADLAGGRMMLTGTIRDVPISIQTGSQGFGRIQDSGNALKLTFLNENERFSILFQDLENLSQGTFLAVPSPSSSEELGVILDLVPPAPDLSIQTAPATSGTITIIEYNHIMISGVLDVVFDDGALSAAFDVLIHSWLPQPSS